MKKLRPVESGIARFRANAAPLARGSLSIRPPSGAVCSSGFSLIELMIVVAIIAILTAIAYPAYTNYITKTRRVAAEGCLSEFSNYMERYYTTNLRYDQSAPASGSTAVPNALPALDCKSTQRTGANYTYGFPATATSLTASIYTVKATPIPSTAQAKNDTQCGTLSIDQKGKRDASGPGGAAKCW